MKKDKIIDILKTDRQFLKENYGVEVIALFGLYAKDIENPESDIECLC